MDMLLHVCANREVNIEEMTAEEKLKAMEMLWDDLCRRSPDFSSPSWHEDVLKEREQRIKDGKNRFVDWDQAKKDIRSSIT
jgi:hypothetical protein